MPSNKDPFLTVNPGPGKLPAGTVSASSLTFISGGGGGAALLAHITDPVDAHMASAIGVNPTDPVSGLPILASAGGAVDGESVLDFINQAKDLFPERPNALGAFTSGIPNTGIPTWDQWDPASVRSGAWTNGATAVFTHFVLDSTLTTPSPFGKFYPADRGVLAVYRSTDGDFTNAGTTSLYAAIWLGETAQQPVALTCPSAAFNPALRSVGQADYLPSLAGLDQIALAARVPAAKVYGVLPPMDPFTFTFNAYQLAYWGLNMPAVAAGSNDSWLLVHWKETYAVSDASIAPAAIAGNYNATNVYSEVPGNLDVTPVDSAGVQSINRRYVFADSSSATLPTLASWTVTFPPAAYATAFLSGVEHYTNDGSGPLSWDSDLRVNGLVANSWVPGKVTGAELPANFVTSVDPIEYDFSQFGGGTDGRAYYQLRQTGSGSTYTIAAAPLPAHQVQDLSAGLSIPSATPHTPTGGAAQLRVNANRPYVNDVFTDPTLYLFNSWPQTGGSTSSTPTFEPFRDEKYRYSSTATLTATSTIVPAPADQYVSTAAIIAASDDAQVIGDQLVYPQVNYSVGYSPVGPDYSAVFAADAATKTRVHIRAFNTGLARATGRIRIKGIAYADFAATAGFTGVPPTDHPGGVLLLIKVPGTTGWLDLGRPLGSPDLNMAANFRGVQTSVDTSTGDVIVTYNTVVFTADNGAGEFPLFVGAAFVKGTGSGKSIDEIEWLAP